MISKLQLELVQKESTMELEIDKHDSRLAVKKEKDNQLQSDQVAN